MRARQRATGLLLGAVLVILAGCTGAPPLAPRCGGDVAGFAHREARIADAGIADGRVGDVRLHYLIGGQGPPVVLLHGFPETWAAWRHVMPRLARRHTVIVPDLRGIGCSSLEPSGYDKQTMAQDVHRLVSGLGFARVAVVGHDLGGMVAFAYARSHPREVSHLAVSGALLPGFGLERLLDFTRPGQGLPHLVFFMQREVPERLISGREREFLAHFIGSPTVVTSDAFDSYVRAYSRPGRLSAALDQYRALHQDGADNRRGLTAPLPMPVLALSGDRAVTGTADSLRQVARDVRVVVVPGAGHYLPEERPAEFAGAVLDLLARAG